MNKHFECQKRFFEYDYYKPSRVMYMGSAYEEDDGECGINHVTSETVVKSLLLLNEENNDPITIFYNMIGGYWTHGMAIYDMMRASPSPITIIGLGCVRSMGTIIMQAAHIRLLSESTRFMIHDGFDGYSGLPKDLEVHAKESEISRLASYEIYYQALKNKYFKGVQKKKAIKQIDDWCSHDKYFSAQEAVDMGFVDGFWTGEH